MSEPSRPVRTDHAFNLRKGVDWCRLCGEMEAHPIHGKRQMTIDYSTHPILRFFEYEHLDKELQEVSYHFHHLAWLMAKSLPPGAETAVCLRKLLEAKDAAVRAAL